MFISQDRLDVFARLMVATGKHVDLRKMLNYYEIQLERVKQENPTWENDISLQQDPPMQSMGD